MKKRALPILISTLAISAGGLLCQLEEVLAQAKHLEYISSSSQNEKLDHGQHYLINGNPNSSPDPELGLTFFHGWLRCAGYHQIDVFVLAHDRGQADKLISRFEAAVNTHPNERKDIFASNTLEYHGQVVYEDVDLEHIQKKSIGKTNGLIFTIMPYV